MSMLDPASRPSLRGEIQSTIRAYGGHTTCVSHVDPRRDVRGRPGSEKTRKQNLYKVSASNQQRNATGEKSAASLYLFVLLCRKGFSLRQDSRMLQEIVGNSYKLGIGQRAVDRSVLRRTV